MKAFVKSILTVLLIAFASISAMAANPTRYFNDLSGERGFDYSYVSPVMLKAMGEQYLTDKSYGNLPISTKHLTSIETISTISQGTNQELWKIIKELVKSKKMETLSSKKTNLYRYDIMAHMTSDNKYITNLMVITQNTGSNVSVVYMEGKIPTATLQYALNNK